MRLQFVVNQGAEKATGKGLSWERWSPAPSFLLWLLLLHAAQQGVCQRGRGSHCHRSHTGPWKSCAWKQADTLGEELKNDSEGWGDGLVGKVLVECV